MEHKFKKGDVLQLIDQTRWSGRWAGKLVVEDFYDGYDKLYIVSKPDGSTGYIAQALLMLYEEEFKVGTKVQLKEETKRGWPSGWSGHMTVLGVDKQNDKLIRVDHPKKGTGSWFRSQLDIVKDAEVEFKVGDIVKMKPEFAREYISWTGELPVVRIEGEYIVVRNSNGFEGGWQPMRFELVKPKENSVFRIIIGPLEVGRACAMYSYKNFESVESAEKFIFDTNSKEAYDELVIMKAVKTLKKTKKKVEKVVVEETVVWE